MNININKLWLAALPLAFVACQNEEVLMETPQPAQPKTPIKVLQGNMPEQMGSRAQIILENQEEGYELFVWNAHDSFVVYNQSNFDAQHPAVFTISDSYSDDAPMSHADFSTDSNDLLIGDRISAVYPSSCVNEEGYAMMEIPNQEFVNGSDEEWRTYFSNYMYMMAQTTFDSETPELFFEHQSAIIRVTYYNATSEDQKIKSVIVDGHDTSFLRARNANMQDGGQSYTGHGNWLQNDFSDLTVAAGETKEFYFLLLGENSGEYAEGSSLVIHVDTEQGGYVTSELPMARIAEANNGVGHIEKGKRYWFNVMQTESELKWTMEDGILITNLPLIAAIEESTGIQFTKNSAGYVNVLENEEAILNVLSLNLSKKGLTDLSGIEHFANLQELYCNDNELTSLDVSKNKQLRVLYAYRNKLTSLITNEELMSLSCWDNNLIQLDVTRCTNLTFIDCGYNQLTSFDLTNCPLLQYVNCYTNQITSLDLTNCVQLEGLACEDNPLEDLKLGDTSHLVNLFIGRTGISSLPITDASKLERLTCYENGMTELDVTNMPSLIELDCSYNQLTELNVSGNPKLTMLQCYVNQITSLDLTANSELTHVYCWNNRITELNVSANQKLQLLNCMLNRMSVLDITANSALEYVYCGKQRDTDNVFQNILVKLTETQQSDNVVDLDDVNNNGVTLETGKPATAGSGTGSDFVSGGDF